MKQNTRRFAAVSALAVLSLGGLVACGSDDDSSSKSNTNTSSASKPDSGSSSAGAVQIEAKEYEFIPPDVEAAAGSVTFEVKNAGTIEHDFTVEGHEDAKIAVKKPGTSETGTMSLSAGDYVIYCSVPGHREMGMQGTLTVK